MQYFATHLNSMSGKTLISHLQYLQFTSFSWLWPLSIWLGSENMLHYILKSALCASSSDGHIIDLCYTVSYQVSYILLQIKN